MGGKDNNQNSEKLKKTIKALGLAVGILLIAVILLSIKFIPANQDSEANMENEYNFLNPARQFYNHQNLIVNFQPLRDFLDQFEADPNVSIYFEFLNTGASIAVHRDAEFYPASLLKVPVAMATAKKIERGEWRWDNKLVLMSADKDDRYGTLYREEIGSTWTIEELIRRSLSDSDNTAHFILVRNLELEEINDVYDHMGLKDFLSTSGYLSAKRYSVIFRSLYNASYLASDVSQKLLTFLSQSDFNNYLQSGLPENITFSHKIGESSEPNVFLDSGIVFSAGRPYILTVIVQTRPKEKAEQIMKNISQEVYKYVNEYVEE
ncbi:MAG: hypothetical protein A3J48_00950 [Candidatus Doudnabacteria bacterium RIFCSPHIGHO2_02_FULL_46_11]|uniref:Beta-lactamase class A catalytic domain-containing protein n=1 Tax=Candidatus Doudnabacteria bacterium RIFCSPHIGHO2_02_FULL_46_11 TaxID=1817832 RepID=A0A1F5P7H6_9BACT|nr:MAG: hypothetical protein A3J48_00950 [Candidatus Doudnabacteria bacterium RIFCSPHIGHO2_02_FULL_46_11]